MKRVSLLVIGLVTLGGSLGQAQAVFSTDRLGYTGTALRYNSLTDLQTNTNVVDTINIGDRDGSLYFDGTYSVIMGSWWYTTADNTNGYPKDDPLGNRLNSGWGNTNGNTGLGFIQLYDPTSSTVDSFNMGFSGFDGTYWTEASLNVSGSNADYSNAYARFSLATPNSNDAGVFISYDLALTVYGLEGTETSPGVVEATNHPTGVLGTLHTVFYNDTASANAGYYDVTLDFDMTNWAFSQGDALLNGDFADSYFRGSPVPEPASVGAMGVILLAGFVGLRRIRRRKA